MKKLAIIIPAFNEERSIGNVLASVPKKIAGINSIIKIVINDGSDDQTVQKAKKADVVLSHPVNLGVGAATITGFEYAKKIEADFVVTLDADGQHNPKDLAALVKPVLSGQADIVSGIRQLSSKTMPTVKRIGNYSMNILTAILYQTWVSDSQTGMRAYNKKALSAMNLNSIGYEICSEIVGEIRKNKFKYAEVPIEVIYTDYSRKKGQNILNSINIFTKLISLKLTKK